MTVVDAGGVGSAGRVLRFLKVLGRRPQDVAHIVVTHHHLDHTGGLARLQEETGARVAAHRLEIPFLLGEMPNPFVHPVLAALTRPIVQGIRPRRVHVEAPLDDGDEIAGLEGFRVLHTPGHTPGSLSLYAPQDGLLIVGDAMEAGASLRGPSERFTMDMEAAWTSIERMARLDVRMVCFSHYPPLVEDAAVRLRQLARRGNPAI